MRREWSSDKLIGSWTLFGEDWKLVGNKSGATRLGFAVLLKFFEIEARFPRSAEEVPAAAVAYVAEQVKVDPDGFVEYQFSGRTIEYHRAQVRSAFGFREFTRGDEDKLAGWLAAEVCTVELRHRTNCARRCWCGAGASGLSHRAGWTGSSARPARRSRSSSVNGRCPGWARTALPAWKRWSPTNPKPGARGLLAELKADPGRVGLETLLREIGKLAAVRAIGLPAGLFSDASEKLVESWRSRAMRSYPSDLREASPAVRLTLLAALCWLRASEITAALVDLLIAPILKVNTRADKRVERELTADLRRVRGKEGILFRLAEAAIENPDKKVRTALYPVVGEKTLRELVREARANEAAF